MFATARAATKNRERAVASSIFVVGGVLPRDTSVQCASNPPKKWCIYTHTHYNAVHTSVFPPIVVLIRQMADFKEISWNTEKPVL